MLPREVRVGDETERCRLCGRELGTAGTAESDRSLCLECAIETAEATLSARKRTSEAAVSERRSVRGILRLVLLFALTIGAIGVIVAQSDDLVDAVTGPEPIRAGAVETNSSADECIDTLWSAAAALQSGGDASGYRCPATGTALDISTEGTVTVVACPNPSEHSAESLSVRSDRLVPEVKLP